MYRRIIIAGAFASLAVPAVAQAHVTIQPSTAAAGGYTVENVRVPNEEEDASTIKVEVKMPPGFAGVSYQKVPGWKVTVKKTKLATPIQTDDGPITEGVDTVTFSGGEIAPGAFQDFPLSLKIPEGKVGSKLTFKAVQTYDNGEVVSWIGAEDADKPAPTLTLTEAQDDHHAAAKPEAGADHSDKQDDTEDAAEEVAATPAATTVVKEKESKTLAIIAIALAAVALAAGLRPRRS